MSLELRNTQHSYKYAVSLWPVVGDVEMHIFEIQILFTKSLANVSDLISVLIRASSEGDTYLHEWYDSWHSFPDEYPEIEREISGQIEKLRKIHPGYALQKKVTK